eukprot:jgi/Galph1/2189/GphlegSOOS_G856.1
MAPHSKSKRMTLRKKYKIQRKVREHHRKLRKQQKKQPHKGTKKHSKELNIPAQFPYKQQVLEEYARQEEILKKIKQANVRAINARETEENSVQESSNAGNLEDSLVQQEAKGSLRRYVKEFKQVANDCDVILEVLDARDPIGTRSLQVEKYIMSNFGGVKRIVLVLNKIDMIPSEVASQWVEYLSTFYPTVTFCASSEKVRKKYTSLTQNLVQLLKSFRSEKHASLLVGVVGYPNVGKSSLINCLHRSQVVQTGATPGVTKYNQEIIIDHNLRLIDCPGIVLEENSSQSLVIRNFIQMEKIDDPIPYVQTILEKIGIERLVVLYSLPMFSTVDEFLALIAKKRGKLKQGGGFDLSAAAYSVLLDWSRGKIPYYSLPPKQVPSAEVSCLFDVLEVF